MSTYRVVEKLDATATAAQVKARRVRRLEGPYEMGEMQILLEV
jgi:hypothetical protein